MEAVHTLFVHILGSFFDDQCTFVHCLQGPYLYRAKKTRSFTGPWLSGSGIKETLSMSNSSISLAVSTYGKAEDESVVGSPIPWKSCLFPLGTLLMFTGRVHF